MIMNNNIIKKGTRALDTVYNETFELEFVRYIEPLKLYDGTIGDCLVRQTDDNCEVLMSSEAFESLMRK